MRDFDKSTTPAGHPDKSEVYRAGPINTRTRRTQAQIQQLERQIVEILEADHPQSVRHVFYRLTDPRLQEPVEKTERGYKQVQQRVAQMRRQGTISYGWIVDATRRGYHTHTYSGGGEFLGRYAGVYRQNLWESVGTVVEVWVESRSLGGVLQRTCAELAVSLYPCGGFSSMTLLWEAAQSIRHDLDVWADQVEIIYAGDYDPAGVLIDQKVQDSLEDHLGRVVGFHRVAVNQDQIQAWDLPTKPRKKNDRRRLDIQETVEAEAIPAARIRGLVRQKVESFLPPGLMQRTRAAEKAERESLQLIADALQAHGTENVLERLP